MKFFVLLCFLVHLVHAAVEVQVVSADGCDLFNGPCSGIVVKSTPSADVAKRNLRVSRGANGDEALPVNRFSIVEQIVGAVGNVFGLRRLSLKHLCALTDNNYPGFNATSVMDHTRFYVTDNSLNCKNQDGFERRLPMPDTAACNTAVPDYAGESLVVNAGGNSKLEDLCSYPCKTDDDCDFKEAIANPLYGFELFCKQDVGLCKYYGNKRAPRDGSAPSDVAGSGKEV